ncbi:MAG: ABC transporter permease, partial [Novibacillus thermophilus]
MTDLPVLIQNEIIKMGRRRRFVVIVLILVVLASLFTYAQYRETQEQMQRTGTVDWRAELQQKIIDAQN